MRYVGMLSNGSKTAGFIDVNGHVYTVYPGNYTIRVARDGTITGVDRNGEIARGVYHVKTPSGEWRTLPKHTDIKDLVVKYGGDNYQET